MLEVTLRSLSASGVTRYLSLLCSTKCITLLEIHGLVQQRHFSPSCHDNESDGHAVLQARIALNDVIGVRHQEHSTRDAVSTTFDPSVSSYGSQTSSIRLKNLTNGYHGSVSSYWSERIRSRRGYWHFAASFSQNLQDAVQGDRLNAWVPVHPSHHSSIRPTAPSGRLQTRAASTIQPLLDPVQVDSLSKSAPGPRQAQHAPTFSSSLPSLSPSTTLTPSLTPPPTPSPLTQDVSSFNTELCPSLEVQLRCANSLQSLNWLTQHASHSLSSEEAAAFVYGAARVYTGEGKSRSKSGAASPPPASTIKAVSLTLLSLAETHARSWDARCLGAFLTAATKLHLNPSLPWLQIISSELCADAGHKVMQLCPSDLAHLCGACAISGHMGKDVWLTLRTVVLAKLSQFSTNSISKTIWAFCCAKQWLTVPLLAALKDQFLRQIQDAQRRECSLALASLAKIDHRDVAFCEAVVKRLLAQKIHLTNSDVASTAHSVASLKYFNMDLFMCFADVLHNKAKMFNPSQLASLSWACARLEHHHTPLLESISRASLHLMPRFRCNDLAGLAWSMVELGHDDPDLFQAMAQQVESKMRSFNLVDLAMTAVAFSKLRTSTDDSYRQLVEQLVECTLPHVKKLHTPPFKASVVGLFGALARVQVYRPQLLEELVGALCSQQLRLRDAATVLRACVVLRYVDDRLIEHISDSHTSPEALTECRRSHGLQHLMAVLQLMVRLGCRSKLQEAAHAWAGSQRTKLATHYRVTVAWCHCILGYKETSTLQRALADLQRRPDVFEMVDARNRRQLLHLRIKLQEMLSESARGSWITPLQAQHLLDMFPKEDQLKAEQAAWVEEQVRAKPRRLQLEVFQTLKRMGLQPQAQQPTADQLFTVCVALQLGHHQFAVQALPVYCFARGPGKGRFMGLVQAELDSIAARGWWVRTVPYEEWVALGSEDEKCQYLKRKLQLTEREMRARHTAISPFELDGLEKVDGMGEQESLKAREVGRVSNETNSGNQVNKRGR